MRKASCASSRFSVVPGATTKRPSSRLGQKLVFVNHGGNCNPTLGIAVLYSHDLTFAPHSDAFGQRDFRGESEGKFNSCTGGNRRVHEEADAAGANVPGLRGLFPHTILGVANRHGQPQREAAGCPLILLGLSHESSGQAVSMAFCAHAVKTVVWSCPCE